MNCVVVQLKEIELQRWACCHRGGWNPVETVLMAKSKEPGK